MKEEISVSEYLQAIDTISRFEDQVKENLTIDEFLVWFEKMNLNANPSRLARALTILKTTKGKTRIFSVSGKDLKPFAGFAKSYGRGLFEIQRGIFFDKALEIIRMSAGEDEKKIKKVDIAEGIIKRSLGIINALENEEEQD